MLLTCVISSYVIWLKFCSHLTSFNNPKKLKKPNNFWPSPQTPNLGFGGLQHGHFLHGLPRSRDVRPWLPNAILRGNSKKKIDQSWFVGENSISSWCVFLMENFHQRHLQMWGEFLQLLLNPLGKGEDHPDWWALLSQNRGKPGIPESWAPFGAPTLCFKVWVNNT